MAASRGQFDQPPPSNPDDPEPIDVDVEGNERQGAGEKIKSRGIGDHPGDEMLNVSAAPVYTFNYFRKNNDGTATCLSCEEYNKSCKDQMFKRKADFVTSKSSTSGKIYLKQTF